MTNAVELSLTHESGSEAVSTSPLALYTPKEVADLMGLSRRRIYDWLHKGWLRGHRNGGRWVITPDDLDLFKRTCVGSHGRLLPSVYDWEPIWKAARP